MLPTKWTEITKPTTTAETELQNRNRNSTTQSLAVSSYYWPVVRRPSRHWNHTRSKRTTSARRCVQSPAAQSTTSHQPHHRTTTEEIYIYHDVSCKAPHSLCDARIISSNKRFVFGSLPRHNRVWLSLVYIFMLIWTNLCDLVYQPSNRRPVFRSLPEPTR